MSGKPTSPMSQSRIVKLEPPQTPPRRQSKRLSGSMFLKTPEQVDLPFSPMAKRSSLSCSPDYKLNAHNVSSPYIQGLKTPRRLRADPSSRAGGEDDDEDNKFGQGAADYSSDDEPAHKLQKTPQFLSPGKKLFLEDREDLQEISSQLKNRLSSALGKLQREKITSSKVINDISSTTIVQSPIRRDQAHSSWPQATNVNLGEGFEVSTPRSQHKVHSVNLGQEKNIGKKLDFSTSPFTNYGKKSSREFVLASEKPVLQSMSPPPKFAPPLAPGQDTESPERNIITEKAAARAAAAQALSNSPQLFSERVHIPAPDEESSAHSALMAALSRQKRKSRSSFSGGRRSSIHSLNSFSTSSTAASKQSTNNVNRNSFTETSITQAQAKDLTASTPPLKLPPINIAAVKEHKGGEEDAVLSLMSLSSPQQSKISPTGSHSRKPSLNANSSSPPTIASPENSTVLPPISGLIRQYRNDKADNDETDVENDETDEEAE